MIFFLFIFFCLALIEADSSEEVDLFLPVVKNCVLNVISFVSEDCQQL